MTKPTRTVRSFVSGLVTGGWEKTVLAKQGLQFRKKNTTILIMQSVEVERMLGVPPPIARLTTKPLDYETLHRLWDGEVADQTALPSKRNREAVRQTLNLVQIGVRALLCVKDLGTPEANTAYYAQQARLFEKVKQLETYLPSL